MPDEEQNGSGGDAPRFMVLYCSIMILLLAFFIIIQSYATQKQEDRFQSGQSSFKRALETCGLGHLMDEYRRWVKGQASGPRYRVVSGDEVPADRRRIDAQREDASAALRQLAQQLQVSNKQKNKKRSVLVAPMINGDSSDKEVRETTELFSTEILPILLEHECAIGIGGFFKCADAQEAEASKRALQKAIAVRDAVLENLSDNTRKRTRGRVYSFCRRLIQKDEVRRSPSGDISVDIFVRHFTDVKERKLDDEQDTS